MDNFQKEYFEEKFSNLHDKIDSYITSHKDEHMRICREIEKNTNDISSLVKYRWILVGGVTVAVFLIEILIK